jgi:hypothetical protein
MDVKLIGLVLRVDDYPHPNVKLALFEEQGLFDVLLDNPLGIRWLLVKELQNLPDFAEKLDSFALVESSWLKNPLIISAMLIRNVLARAHTLSDMQIREPFLEAIEFTGLFRVQQECCREYVKDLY